jgi:hypothetical protein
MSRVVKLVDIADEIRSKNAGPFELTFDIMFDDEQTYRKVKSSGVLTKQLIARLYKVAENHVRHLVWHDFARGVKITIDRPTVSGGPGDRDTYGGQQHAPLLDVEIPWDD